MKINETKNHRVDGGLVQSTNQVDGRMDQSANEKVYKDGGFGLRDLGSILHYCGLVFFGGHNPYW
jgi:hypothetical protein